nr:uncharacterized protein LOC123494508 [Aegilops tauschii subsp. strangulata]
MNARRSANATRPPSRAQAPPPRAPFALPFARIRRRPTGSTRLRCSRRCQSHDSSPRRQAPRRSPASPAPPLPLLHLLSVECRPIDSPPRDASASSTIVPVAPPSRKPDLALLLLCFVLCRGHHLPDALAAAARPPRCHQGVPWPPPRPLESSRPPSTTTYGARTTTAPNAKFQDDDDPSSSSTGVYHYAGVLRSVKFHYETYN